MPEEEFFLAFAGSLINRGARGTNRTLPHPMGFLADIFFVCSTRKTLLLSHSSLERVRMVHCLGRRAEEYLCQRGALRSAASVRLVDVRGITMAVGTLRSWKVRSIVIARVCLATTLLLGISDWASRVTFYSELAILLELVLGAAIAVGWRIRYAAALVFFGTLAAATLAPYLHLVLLPAHPATTAAVLITSGILVCFGQNTEKGGVDTFEDNPPSSESLCTLPHETWENDIEVTIRLEDSHILGQQRYLAVATIHDHRRGSEGSEKVMKLVRS